MGGPGGGGPGGFGRKLLAKGKVRVCVGITVGHGCKQPPARGCCSRSNAGVASSQ